MGQVEADGVTGEGAEGEQRAHDGEADEQTAQAHLAGPLPGRGHVGHRVTEHACLP